MLYTFQDNKIPPFTYSGDGGSWLITTAVGAPTLRPPAIGDGQTTNATITVGGGLVAFYYYICSEYGHDYFELYVNGSMVINVSGVSGWYYYYNMLPDGEHTLLFRYTKDSSMSYGCDTVFIYSLTLNPADNKYSITTNGGFILGNDNYNIRTSLSILTDGKIILGDKVVAYSNNCQPGPEFSLEYEKNVYNLSDDLIDTIEVYIEPILLNNNVDGHNELTHGLYLLSDHYIDIKINKINFHMYKNNVGASATNPIIFKRFSYEEKEYFYGSDSTLRGSDWIRYINHTDKSKDIINSLPSSGNIVYNKVYLLNHAINYSSTDYIKIQIFLKNNLPSSKLDLLKKQFKNCRIIISQSAYNKNISNTIGVLYGDEIIVRESGEYNVRW
jgi:hypothetical protein